MQIAQLPRESKEEEIRITTKAYPTCLKAKEGGKNSIA
jgi:hypothetical protein